MTERYGFQGSLTTNSKGHAYADISGPLDAFGRVRVSEPTTVFDSKQLFDNAPLFWDEALESGAGITSSHSTDTASTVITSTLNTAGKFTRQTFRRFNYQPGKSQKITITGVLDRSGGGTGVQRQLGLIDDSNGLYFEDDEGTMKVVIRSSTSGSPVETKIAQADWNYDKMDGTGPSGITADWTKAQIFGFDFEWLGVGSVGFFMRINRKAHYVHFHHTANIGSVVYMSTPNLPLRAQMVTTASSPASSMEIICCEVESEGGLQEIGPLRYVDTGGTHVACNAENTLFAVVGIRLKATHLAATICLEKVSILEHKIGQFYAWYLFWNPTVAGTFTYNDVANSAVQYATGATANTISGTPHQIDGGHGATENATLATVESVANGLRLGSGIDGTPDEIVLAVRPIGGSSDMEIEGGIGYREAY